MPLGVFTVPVTGVWRVSFSLTSDVNTGNVNWVYIYHNQEKIVEAEHSAYNENNGIVSSTGGRELITRAERGDTFHLGTARMDYKLFKIITCFEFLSL